jgi:hypothetical protein
LQPFLGEGVATCHVMTFLEVLDVLILHNNVRRDSPKYFKLDGFVRANLKSLWGHPYILKFIVNNVGIQCTTKDVDIWLDQYLILMGNAFYM